MPLTRTGAYRNNGEAIFVGEDAGQVGTMTATGPGVALNLLGVPGDANNYSAGELNIGGSGTGTLTVRANGVVRVQNLDVGEFSGGRGTTTISGGGRLYTIAQAGGPAYRGVDIGVNQGSVGTLTVTGEGSILESSGGAGVIRAGRFGDGTLNILGGADARCMFFDIARNDGGRGTVTVDGAGSRLLISDAFGFFVEDPGEAGFGRLGREAGSYGRLTVSNGGTVDVQNDPTGDFDGPAFVVGFNTGSRGRLVVDGAGSAMNITLTGASTDAFAPESGFYYGPRLNVGSRGGTGDVVVSNGGAVNVTGEAARIDVGRAAALNGTTLQSTLVIESGGVVRVTALDTEARALVSVGSNAGAIGALRVEGAGSRLVITSDNRDNVTELGGTSFGAALIVGDEGEGQLRVTEGGQVTVDGADDAFTSLIVGYGATGSGTALISGAGTTLTIAAAGGGTTATSGHIIMAATAGAYGLMQIADGAVVDNSSAFATTRLAQAVDAQAILGVAGAGTELRAGALLSVGNRLGFNDINGANPLPVVGDTGGYGTLSITAGAVVTAGRTVIGADSTLVLGDGELVGDAEIRGELVLTPIPGALLGAVNRIDGDLVLADTATLASGLILALDDAMQRIVVGGDASIDAGLAVEFAVADTARYGRGQQLVVLEAASVDAVDIAVAGTDFRLRSVGDTLVFEAQASRGGFSLDRSASATNDIILDTNAGTVRVRGGALAGETAGGVGLIDGSAAADRIVSAAGLTREMTIDAGSGDDVVQTTTGNNTVFGGDGADRLFSRQGSDTLFGGAGGDVLSAFEGDDTIHGGAGNDTITGWRGSDSITGGDGDDVIRADFDGDVIEGGAGADRILGGSSIDTFVFRLGFQEDRLLDFNAAVEKLDFSQHTGVDAFADLTVAQVGTTVLITDGFGGRIVLADTARAEITAGDFLF